MFPLVRRLVYLVYLVLCLPAAAAETAPLQLWPGRARAAAVPSRPPPRGGTGRDTRDTRVVARGGTSKKLNYKVEVSLLKKKFPTKNFTRRVTG